MMNKLDKLARSSFRKRRVDHVAIVWRGKPGVDSIIAVYEDTAAAMNVSNDGQTNLTQVMLGTPRNIGDDGRIWVLCDGAGIFAVFPAESTARQHMTIYGGEVKSFTLNAGKSASGGDLQKAALDALKASHVLRQSMWR